ncbi:MAG: TonB-dependent receptor [Saprospiraceae bacterium]
MKKVVIAILLFLTIALNLNAQYNLQGKLVNEQDQPLEYATVALLNPTDSLLLYFGVSNTDGIYQIKGIKSGSYIIQFSFVGLKTAYDQLTMPLDSGDDLGVRQLQTETQEEVIVEAELIPIQFKNDTLEFNVEAFITRPGAAAEEVLRQLPGLEVDAAGNIKAEGEEVVKVLVDGKEFFDRDPKVATKNLPADALSKVQVIDRKTEEAIFTGVDDGLREKTINLQLKADRRQGYFGEISAGLGTEDTYRLEGKVYQFTEKTQNAVLGLYNNINEFGFTNKDNQSFGGNNKGINEALAGGVNLSYNPDNENRYFINYLGNRRLKELEETVNSENFLSNNIYRQAQDITQEDTDRPHKLNFGIRHNFNPQQRLILDGVFNTRSSDILTKNFTSSTIEKQLINTLDNQTTDFTKERSIWGRATYISKFRNEKNQFKVEIGGQLNDNDTRLDWLNNTQFFNPISENAIQQFQANSTDLLSLYAEPSFLKKLNNSWTVSLGIRLGLEDNGLAREEGILNDLAEFEELDIPLTDTRQQQLSPLFILNRVGKQSQLNLRLETTFNQFDRQINGLSIQKNTYFFLIPNFSYRNEYRSGRRINVGYSSRFNMPTVDQLIPVINQINPLNSIQGNPALEPEKNHEAYIGWTLFDQFSFTAFSMRLSGTYTLDKIRWAEIINENLARLTRPLNVDNEANLNFYADFSKPLRSIGLNLKLTLRENWNRSIVFINQVENINTNLSHGFNLSIENRKNDIFSVRLGASIDLTDARFSITNTQNNLFFNTNYTGFIRYTPNRKWNFETRIEIRNFNAQGFEESISVPLLGANLSYYFLKAETGTLSISAFDLLNQYTGVQRTSNANFLLQQQWNTLQQYFMLTFNWRFR